MSEVNKISYVEFPAADIAETKTFFSSVFGWKFKDYGDAYISFSNQGIKGGFYKSEKAATTGNGSALIVLYSDDLKTTQAAVEEAGGLIIKPVFSFPGGYRFHFTDPNGNELAVWSEQNSTT